MSQFTTVCPFYSRFKNVRSWLKYIFTIMYGWCSLHPHICYLLNISILKFILVLRFVNTLWKVHLYNTCLLDVLKQKKRRLVEILKNKWRKIWKYKIQYSSVFFSAFARAFLFIVTWPGDLVLRFLTFV